MNNETTLKERFDKAFYGLLNAGNRLQEVSYKVEYAGNLVKLNKLKQNQVQLLMENNS